MPGASVLVVATHIDCATEEEVERQVAVVKTTVEHTVKQYEEDEAVTRIPSLTVWQGGESLRVNCLDGTGRVELKQSLIEMAHALPWWEESIPKSIVMLKSKIEEASLRNTWL